MDQNFTPIALARNLGITFDKNKNFRQHISQLCHFCFYHIRDVGRIRRYLPLSVAKTIATSLFSSRLDHCNSLGYIIILLSMIS